MSCENYILPSLRGRCLIALLTRFFPVYPPPSHEEVLDMEIQLLLERFAQKDPKSLMKYIEKMASEEALFFPTTLSLIYDKLIENALSGPTGSQSVFHPTPPQASTSTSSVTPFSTISPTVSSSNLQAPASIHVPVPSTTPTNSTSLRCIRCGELIRLRDLYQGLRCPQCTPINGWGRPIMQCVACDALRTECREDCHRQKCRRMFL